VSIPFKEDVTLGDSKKQAIARYMNLEKKLKRNEKLKVDYTKFMNEYMDLGHMIEVNDEGKYFLPHQAVIRDSSLTTKLRVVFDASAKTTNNKSLNDIMWVGPRVQKDIFDIIIKWRKWEFVVSADIEKMYRQIKIDNNDQKYQYILWRNSPKEKIKTYKLTTVTYGTASAPYLATRVLVDIADKCKNQVISAIIRNDFYMDDLMTGADSVEEPVLINTVLNDKIDDPIYELIERYSSIEKLIRIIAYINRFVQMKTRNKAYSSIISVKEIRIAETVVIKKQQEYQFRQEIKCLKIKKEIKTNNKILSLNPFLDKDGVLRVGGRLQNSNAEFNVKHPIILEKCHLTSLLIKNAHKETLHGGINLMRNYIQRKYWIFGLKNSLKKLFTHEHEYI